MRTYHLTPRQLQLAFILHLINANPPSSGMNVFVGDSNDIIDLNRIMIVIGRLYLLHGIELGYQLSTNTLDPQCYGLIEDVEVLLNIPADYTLRYIPDTKLETAVKAFRQLFSAGDSVISDRNEWLYCVATVHTLWLNGTDMNSVRQTLANHKHWKCWEEKKVFDVIQDSLRKAGLIPQ